MAVHKIKLSFVLFLAVSLFYSISADTDYQITGISTFIDTAIIYSPIHSFQNTPIVTYGDTNYFVVWHDLRSRIEYKEEASFFGTRVSRSGKIIDSAGIEIVHEKNPLLLGDVIYGGEYYFIVWNRIYDDAYKIGNVYGKRINKSGAHIDTGAIPICLNKRCLTPRISLCDSLFFVVWFERFLLAGARISKSGTLIDTTPIHLTSNNYDNIVDDRPAVAFNGENFIVVWKSFNNQIYCTRINRQGEVLDKDGIAITANDNEKNIIPAIACIDTLSLAVWSQNNPATSRYEMFCSRLSRTCTVLDPQGIKISPNNGISNSYPCIASNGNNFFVIWRAHSAIFGAVVSREGIVEKNIDINVMSGGSVAPARVPSIITDGTDYFSVWIYNPAYQNLVAGARFSQTGTIIDPDIFTTPYSANSQTCPSLAFDGSNFFMVWQDTRNGSLNQLNPEHDIFGKRIDLSGAIMDAQAFPIKVDPFNEQTAPGIAFGKDNYLVVWGGSPLGALGGPLAGALVSKDGKVLSSDIVINPVGTNPKVVFNGMNYTVFWNARVVYPFDLCCRRVALDGTFIDSDSICIAHRVQDLKTICGNKTILLVYNCYDLNRSYFNYIQRVSFDCMLIDTQPLRMLRGTSCTGAFDGVNFMATGPAKGYIFSEEGIVSDSFAYPDTLKTVLAVTYDGEQFLVMRAPAAGDSICITAISRTGAMGKTWSFPSEARGIENGVFAHGANGKCFAGYSGYFADCNNRPANSWRLKGFAFDKTIAINQIQKPVKGFNISVYHSPDSKYIYIDFNLPQSIVSKGRATLDMTMYNSLGQCVVIYKSTLNVSSGDKRVAWNINDGSGKKAAMGVYFIRVNVGGISQIKKLVLF